MKAISFLEYYRKAEAENFFEYNCYAYFNKVSQPFSFEKVVELFEGFEKSKCAIPHSNQYNYENIEFVISDVKIHIYKETFFPFYIVLIPKTIDEFIVLCNNLNIELEWKNQEV